MISLLARFYKAFYVVLFLSITIFSYKTIGFLWNLTDITYKMSPFVHTLISWISGGIIVFLVAFSIFCFFYTLIKISDNPKNIEAKEISQLGYDLYEKKIGIPIIDIYLNFEATFRLIKNGSPKAACELAYAISRDIDQEIRKTILKTLSKINNKSCIDEICEAWSHTRHQDLADLIVKQGWVASSPIKLRVLTALKTKKLLIITDGGQEIVEPLLEAFEDRDIEIANQASECAILFDNPKCKNFLLDLIIKHNHPIACQIAIKAKYVPHELSQRALFYFLTEQWEKYETLDYEHSLLKKVYELGNEKLRKQIAEKVKQSGRAEWVQIVAGGRKSQRLEKMTDAEWEATLDVLSNNKQWEEIWQLAQKAPPVWSKKLLQNLKQASWQPSVEEERTGFESLKQLADKFSGITVPSTSCRKSLVDPNSIVEGISFSPDGQLLASFSNDKTIRLWRMPDGQHLVTLTGHTESVKGISFSRDGQLFASCSSDKTIRLWRMPDGQHLATLTGHTESVKGISFSRDGQLFASCSSDKTIRLWRMPDGQHLATLTGHTADVREISFSPNGQLLASYDFLENTVRLWRMPDGQPLTTLTGHTAGVLEISFSPDGQILASCSRDNTVRLWRMPDGKNLATLTGHTAAVWGISFSPDGQLLTSCSSDNTVRLWRMSDGQHQDTLTGHTAEVLGINLSPDGQLLASFSCDNTVRLWRMPDGQHLATLTDHYCIKEISFSPNGQLLASCSLQNYTVSLWLSSVFQLSRLPIKQLSLHNREQVQKLLQDVKITEHEQHSLEFMQALMDWYQRFDVEVDDAPQLVSTGEFDIEIEG